MGTETHNPFEPPKERKYLEEVESEVLLPGESRDFNGKIAIACQTERSLIKIAHVKWYDASFGAPANWYLKPSSAAVLGYYDEEKGKAFHLDTPVGRVTIYYHTGENAPENYRISLAAESPLPVTIYHDVELTFTERVVEQMKAIQEEIFGKTA